MSKRINSLNCAVFSVENVMLLIKVSGVIKSNIGVPHWVKLSFVRSKQ